MLTQWMISDFLCNVKVKAVRQFFVQKNLLFYTRCFFSSFKLDFKYVSMFKSLWNYTDKPKLKKQINFHIVFAPIVSNIEHIQWKKKLHASLKQITNRMISCHSCPFAIYVEIDSRSCRRWNSSLGVCVPRVSTLNVNNQLIISANSWPNIATPQRFCAKTKQKMIWMLLNEQR